MEHPRGPRGTGHGSSLKLVGPDEAGVWEPDPARDAEDLDALTELFIGDPADDEHTDGGGPAPGTASPSSAGPGRASRCAGVRASLEAIITGHLPVRGTLWVRAYAARVARERGGPVGLVRVSPERTTVELVGSAAETDPIADVGVAIEAARAAADQWLLHFDELDQARLLRAGELDRITVLSGADEPAIVSAYRLFKTMVELGEDAVRAGVSIVGADETNTERATSRIVGATRQFLGIELEPRVGVPRVESTHTALIGDCGRRVEPTEIITMIQASDGAEPETPSSRVGPRGHAPGPVSVPAGGPIRTIKPETPGPRDEHLGDDTREADSVDMFGELPDPAELVPDLTPLGLPCPVSPGVSLAADPAGRVHVVAWWNEDAPAGLLKAAAWGRVNAPLLAKVCPGVNAETCTPAQHIVCVDLAVAADLRGTKTIVHLAQPVEQRPKHGWLCGRVN